MTRKFKGMAATFAIDLHRDKIDRKAMEKALAKYMQNAVLTRNFDPTKPIGVITDAVITDHGVDIQGTIQDDKTWDLIKGGIVNGIGIGGMVKDHEIKRDSDKLYKEIKDFDLHTISIVDVPVHKSQIIMDIEEDGKLIKVEKLELENHHKVVEDL